MYFKKAMVGTLVALMMAGCAMDDPDDIGTTGQNVRSLSQVEILEVGYGGTTTRPDGDKVILPEFIILFNNGKTPANIGGWYVSDGGNWGGDGVDRFPNGTVIQPGDMLVIANYPPVTHFESYWGYRQISFEEAHGYAPDLEIAGWNDEIDDLIRVGGRIRLKHRQCTYDGDCWAVTETVYLIDGAHLSDAEIIRLLETDSVDQDLLVSVFPEPEQQ